LADGKLGIILDRKPEGYRSRSIWETNIKMDLKIGGRM
jgi:hypothetical protein